MTILNHERPRILLGGASGRLGRMVRFGWRGRTDFIWAAQARSPIAGGSLIWDPAAGPGPLLDEIARNGVFSAMVVLAGVVPGSQASTHNAELADHYLAAAASASIPRVLLASSSAVYGARAGAPFLEMSPCHPSSSYGTDKLAQEGIARRWQKHGIETCSLRIGNVAGADALLDYRRGTQVRTIDTFSDGSGPVRSWIDGLTLADILADLLLSPSILPKVLNVACTPPHAMDRLASLAGLPFVRRPAAPGTPQSLALDTGLLESLCPSVSTNLSAEHLIARWNSLRDTS